MDAKLRKKALTLWREFARHTYSLDVEAVDALLLRDQLEADLGRDRDEVLKLDEEIAKNRHERLADLERSGAMASIRELRESGGASGRWWWNLDYELPKEPAELPARSAARPSATRRADTAPKQIDVPDFLAP